MDKWINLCEPITGIEEINSVSKALKDGWVSSAGPVVCEAEKMVCEKTGAKFGVACTSGTSALHLSLICSGVNRSEHVIVPSLSFIASVNPVLYCGADPIFLDSDSDYGYIDPLGLVSFLREETLIKKNLLIYKKTNRVIRAMIVTDLLGHPAPWELYRSIRGDIPLVFIEDSAQSLGSKAGYRLFKL
jgi:dTDP-4-amino-4,6-dideoxygalactose transaminase